MSEEIKYPKRLVNKKQKVINQKFAKYLKISTTELNPKVPDDMEFLTFQQSIEKTRGLCQGYAVTHGVMHLLENVKRGMPAWWDNVLHHIALWDEQPDSLDHLILLKNSKSAKPLREIFDQAINYVISNQFKSCHPALENLSQERPDLHFSALLPRAPSSAPALASKADSLTPPVPQECKDQVMVIDTIWTLPATGSKQLIAILQDDKLKHSLANNICLIDNGGHVCSLRFDLQQGGWFLHDSNYDSREYNIIGQEKFFSDAEYLTKEIHKILRTTELKMKIWHLVPEEQKRLNLKQESKYDKLSKANLQSQMIDGGLIKILSKKLFMQANEEVIIKVISDEKLFPAAQINYQNSQLTTPLIFASFQNNEAVMQALLERKADKTLKNQKGNYAFTGAVCMNNVKYLKLLLPEGDYINSKDNEQMTALMKAVLYGHEESTSFLLGHGAQVDIENNNGWTALIWAAAEGNTKNLQLLLENHADINHQTKDGKSALMTAVIYGNKETVKCLINNDADITIKDTNGLNAIELAAMQGDLQIADILLEALKRKAQSVQSPGEAKAGGDPVSVNIKAYEGIIFRYAAAQGNADIVKKYLQQGVDIQSLDSEGNDAFTLAARRGYFEICKILFPVMQQQKMPSVFVEESVASDNSVRENKESKTVNGSQNLQQLLEMIAKALKCDDTPLLLQVVQMHTTTTLDWLLKHHKTIDINVADREGRTALIRAVAKGDLEMIRFLLQRTVDKSKLLATTTLAGDTALSIAAGSGRVDIFNYLIASGADLTKNPTQVLLKAISRAEYVLIEFLLRKNIVIENVAIESALKLGYFEIAQWLLDKKNSMNCEKDFKETGIVTKNPPLLLWAVNHLQSDAERIVRRLLEEFPVVIDEGDDDRTTPLLSALIQKKYTLAKLLLDFGASTILENTAGVTAQGFTDQVDKSIQRSVIFADKAFAYFLRSFLHEDFWRDDHRTKAEIARCMPNINRYTEDGSTALHLAVQTGKLMPVALKNLLKRGALNLPDQNGQTPLHCASCLENQSAACVAVKLILHYSHPLININELDQADHPAIYYIAKRGLIDLIELFRNKGANCDQALLGAVKGRHFPIVAALLLNKGGRAFPKNISEAGLQQAAVVAVKSNEWGIAWKLLNAHKGSCDESGQLLLAAARANQAEFISLLIGRGANYVQALQVLSWNLGPSHRIHPEDNRQAIENILKQLNKSQLALLNKRQRSIPQILFPKSSNDFRVQPSALSTEIRLPSGFGAEPSDKDKKTTRAPGKENIEQVNGFQSDSFRVSDRFNAPSVYSPGELVTKFSGLRTRRALSEVINTELIPVTSKEDDTVLSTQ